MMRLRVLVLILFLALVVVPHTSTFAQEPAETPTETPTITPTPTATPTPAYWQAVTLTSGNQFIIERKISYGEIAIAVVGLGLLAFLVVVLMLFIPKVYL
jgi:hypothetical protein